MNSLVRRTASAVMAAVLLLGGGTASLAQSSLDVFADTAGSYAEQEIEALTKAGVLAGYGNGTFKPYATTTRAEAAKAIVAAMGLQPDPNGAQSFRDVAADAWYRGYVGALAQSGIANGVAPNRFAPEAPITREQLVVLYMRALGMEHTSDELSSDAEISDFAEVASWAKPYITFAAQLGFVSGILTEDTPPTFQPKTLADRQALAQLTYEYFVNREVYEDLLDQWLNDEPVKSIPSIAAVSAIDNRTVKVTFEEAVQSVSAQDFRFEPALAIMKTEQLVDGRSVVLTTEAQLPGTVYKLMYQDKLTGMTIVGVGSGNSSSGGDEQDEPENVAELLAAGGTLERDVTITASGVYGPSDESGLTTTLAGTFIIDPGPDGEVELRNIRPDKLDVLSGKDESIKLAQTVVKQLRVNVVNNGGRDVRIEARDGAEVESVSVESQAILETSSSTAKLGKIRLDPSAANKTLTLRGIIDGDVVVDAPGSSIKLEPPSGGSGGAATELRSKLLLNAPAKLTAPANTLISQVTISGENTAVTVEGEGQISQITVDNSATGASLELRAGAKIAKIQALADIVLSGDPDAIVGVEIEGEGGVSIDDSVKEDVKEAAVDNAREAIDALDGDDIVYSEQLLEDIDRAVKLVEAARGYGAKDEDIPSLSKLQSIQDAIYQLKNDVMGDAASLKLDLTVTATLVLPTRGAKGSDITWASSNEAVIHPNGTVTRPAIGEPDAAVSLAATVAKQGYTFIRTFNVTVLAETAPEVPSITELIYESSVTLDKATRQLLIRARYSDNALADITNSVTGWSSTNPAAATVSSTGLLTSVSNGTTIVTAEVGDTTVTIEVTVVDLNYSLAPTIYTSSSPSNRLAEGYDTAVKINSGPEIPIFISTGTNPYWYVEVIGITDAHTYSQAEIAGLDGAEVVGVVGNYLVIQLNDLVEGTYNLTLSGLTVTLNSVDRTIAPIPFTIRII